MRLAKQIMLLAFLLAVGVPTSTFGQTARLKPAPAVRPGDVVKVSSFDPAIQYRACDPIVTGGPQRRVWTRPGSNPMVPPDLLMRAGLNGRSTRDFQRAVGGPTPGEQISDDERVALGLVTKDLHDGFVSMPGHTEDQWREFQNLVANDGNIQIQDYTCGEKIDYMLFGAQPVGDKFTYQSATNQYVAHTGSKRWRIWMNSGGKGEYVDVAWECFNLASSEAPLKPAPVETSTAVTAPAPPEPQRTGLVLPPSTSLPAPVQTNTQTNTQTVNVGFCGGWVCKIALAAIAGAAVICAINKCWSDHTTQTTTVVTGSSGTTTTPSPDTTKPAIPLPTRPAGETLGGASFAFKVGF